MSVFIKPQLIRSVAVPYDIIWKQSGCHTHIPVTSDPLLPVPPLKRSVAVQHVHRVEGSCLK